MLLIIDNQSQLIHNLVERLDSEDIPYEVRAHNDTISDIPKDKVSGVVLSGGPGNPFGPLSLYANYSAIDTFHKVPMLGLCLGMEIIANKFCGTIEQLPEREEGLKNIELLPNTLNDPLFNNLPSKIILQENHDYYVSSIGDDLIRLAYSDICQFEIIKHRERPLYGFQSHPETPNQNGFGHRIITNFLKMCGY